LSRAQRPVTLQPASCRGKHPQQILVFFAFDISYKPLHPNLEIIDAQEIKAPADVRTLKTAAKKKTRAASIARTLKRTEGATRQKAFSLGLSLDSRA